ncbi:hypothetical protein NKJ72_27335 [Mesorhizobium sp. M0045]|uniref:hypothetical protein n=1 Tax=unclassified Mesorhizobium TaxID=325217 RepID=UPI00333CB4EC
MARTKLSKQLSQAEIERFLAEAERLHKSIVQPLLSPTSNHYRPLQRTHEALLKTVKDITQTSHSLFGGRGRRQSSLSRQLLAGFLAFESTLPLSAQHQSQYKPQNGRARLS